MKDYKCKNCKNKINWVSVNNCYKDMPEKSGVYLITYRTLKGRIKVRASYFYGYGSWSKVNDEQVIAWALMPNPYVKLLDDEQSIVKNKRPTYCEDFLKKFPHAQVANGRPKACREEIYKNEPEQCNDCEKCWGEELEETE